MMRKCLFTILALMLVATFCFAQSPRSARTTTYTGREDHTTYVTNIGATGMDTEGNPGFLVLTGTGVDGQYPISYYLWVDDSGDLCIASYSTISAYSSFPTGNLEEDDLGSTCTKVGSQS